MQNKWFKYGLFGLGGILALCIVFSAGIFVGRWSTHRGPFRPFSLGIATFSGNHGAVGTIQSMDGQTIVVRQRDGTSQTVIINDQTHIEHNRRNIALRSLNVGDRVVIIGYPNAQGQVTARFVGTFDASPTPGPWWQFLISR